MDVLAGRKTGGYIGGNITISGYPKKQETFARVSGYCEQNDIHSPHVTVYESLLYSAWLRLSGESNSETRKLAKFLNDEWLMIMGVIEKVIELVELNRLKHAIVGLPGVIGLSTELRKILTIAVVLVANPSIILMDEPTSGLYARVAAVVMRAVRNIVDTGRTVGCTIHQPSIDIFESYDEGAERIIKDIKWDVGRRPARGAGNELRHSNHKKSLPVTMSKVTCTSGWKTDIKDSEEEETEPKKEEKKKKPKQEESPKSKWARDIAKDSVLPDKPLGEWRTAVASHNSK
ncbi:hypothetical protein Fmac_032331 [Flemingia macrophylla]|uniref:ABC transporter domain-containing protein n=1 Tax=Flemingia macrophylla TaxID=520843 RepID=A0ABD1L5Y5_9FABA